MATRKSLDEYYYNIIAALLCDIQKSHSEVFTEKHLGFTMQIVRSRLSSEGIAFLTKALPSLGKELDRALTGATPFSAAKHRFSTLPSSNLPRFLGEIFLKVFSPEGNLLQNPCVNSIRHLRQVLYLFYKLELPYARDLEQAVVRKFIETDESLCRWNDTLSQLADKLDNGKHLLPEFVNGLNEGQRRWVTIAIRARSLVSQLTCNLNVHDIQPRHGPGVVSTKEKYDGKYRFSCVSQRLLDSYPMAEYFFASLSHVCDDLDTLKSAKTDERFAHVCLVPKDSRGPRLISCEPLEFQWIQQGVKTLLVREIESNELTKHSIHFTHQRHNQIGALWGSKTGRYATLDLSEASDRISVGLVRLLFTEPLRSVLLNCRSLGTVLPNGSFLKLQKYAPMGSALCFPVLATCIWSLLSAGLRDAVNCHLESGCIKCSSKGCESLLVYGDDVVVPTAQAVNATRILESFGLAINLDKSCASGFFRESCGQDAFAGESVTPVRLRTVWTDHRCPETYVSYIAYANALHKLGYYTTYQYMVGELFRVYGAIPEVSAHVAAPSLIEVPVEHQPRRRRTNTDLQKIEYLVRDVKARRISRRMDGWKKLLRFFAETSSDRPRTIRELLEAQVKAVGTECGGPPTGVVEDPLTVSTYTERRSIYFVRCWR